MTFYTPEDGYLYGWRWRNGDEAWWSTADLAKRHDRDITGQPGEPIRRRYVVGEIEPWAEQCPAIQLPYLDAVESVRCVHRLGHQGSHEAYWPSRGVISWDWLRGSTTAV